MPLFSVIINNYNYGRYLPAAIDSVLSQRFRDFELIVVDDGSSDNSLSVIQGYGDRLKLVQTVRLGQAGACRMAVAEARGDYIYFLDADDEACPDLLECVSQRLADRPSKIQFQLVPIDATGGITGPAFPNYPRRYGRDKQISEILNTGHYTTPQTSGNIFRADLFGYIDDIDYERAIDGITVLLAPFIGDVVTIPRTLARYRVHGSSDSGLLKPTPQRFQAERARFEARYRHLKRLTVRYRFGAYDFGDPSQMAYRWDREIMMKLCVREPVGWQNIKHFVGALLHERGVSASSIRLLVWLAVCLYGPRRLARLFFEMRSNPWSGLNTFKGLLTRGIRQSPSQTSPAGAGRN
jgi:glycosyltransferase involved in cell wall biosynthesis